jgi:hypothetical protein
MLAINVSLVCRAGRARQELLIALFVPGNSTIIAASFEGEVNNAQTEFGVQQRPRRNTRIVALNGLNMSEIAT